MPPSQILAQSPFFKVRAGAMLCCPAETLHVTIGLGCRAVLWSEFNTSETARLLASNAEFPVHVTSPKGWPTGLCKFNQNSQNAHEHLAVMGRRPTARRSLGSRGQIFCHWPSVRSQQYRGIGPSSGAAYLRSPPPQKSNYPKFIPLCTVLKWPLVKSGENVLESMGPVFA